MKRLDVICRKKKKKDASEFSYRWLRRGTPGRTPTRGGGGGGPSTSWFLLVRPSAPAASAHSGLFSWRGSLCAHRVGTEAPISSSQYQAEGEKKHTQALCCGVTRSREPVWRCVWPVSVCCDGGQRSGSPEEEEEEEVGGGRRRGRRGRRREGGMPGLGWVQKLESFIILISFFHVVLSHFGIQWTDIVTFAHFPKLQEELSTHNAVSWKWVLFPF